MEHRRQEIPAPRGASPLRQCAEERIWYDVAQHRDGADWSLERPRQEIPASRTFRFAIPVHRTGPCRSCKPRRRRELRWQRAVLKHTSSYILWLRSFALSCPRPTRTSWSSNSRTPSLPPAGPCGATCWLALGTNLKQRQANHQRNMLDHLPIMRHGRTTRVQARGPAPSSWT